MSIENCQESAQLLQTLGLPKGSSWETIQGSYQDLMAVWNPERFNGDPALKQRVRKKTSEIKFAYAKLEEMRLAYDRLQFLAGVKGQGTDTTSPIVAPQQIVDSRENLIAISENSASVEKNISDEKRQKLARKLRFLKPVLFLCALPFYIVGSIIRVTSFCLDFLYSTTLFQASLRVAIAGLFVFCIFPKARNISVGDVLASNTPGGLRGSYEGFASALFQEKSSNVPSASYYARFERTGGSMWSQLSNVFGSAESESPPPSLVKTSYKGAQPAHARKM
jgi:hypothetical protein